MRWKRLLMERTTALAGASAAFGKAWELVGTVHERTKILGRVRERRLWRREIAEAHYQEALRHHETAVMHLNAVSPQHEAEVSALLDDYREALQALAFIASQPEDRHVAAMETLDVVRGWAQTALSNAEARMARFETKAGAVESVRDAVSAATVEWKSATRRPYKAIHVFKMETEIEPGTYQATMTQDAEDRILAGDIVEVLVPVLPGNRNDAVLAMARRYRQDGTQDWKARVFVFNATGHPPLPHDEVQRIIDTVSREAASPHAAD